MKQTKVVLWAAAIVAAALVILNTSERGDRGTTNAAEPNLKGFEGVRPSSTRPKGEDSRKVQRKRDLLIIQLRNALEKPVDTRNLIELIPELAEAGLLSDDEVRKAYQRVIQMVSAIDLAAIAALWPSQEINSPNGDLFRAIGNVLARRSPQDVITFFKAIPNDHRFRQELLADVSQTSPLFESETLAANMDEFLPADRLTIGSGLADRINNKIGGRDKKIEAMQEYLSKIQDENLSLGLLKEHLAISAGDEPEETIKWVRNLDEKAAKELDTPIIQALVKASPEVALDYVDEIVAGADRQRSTRALETLIKGYSDQDPRATLEWMQRLPPAVGISDQMLATPIAKWRHSDPEGSRSFIDEITDPNLKAKLQRLWTAHADPNSGK